MITKTLPDIPSKFTGVGEDAAIGETTNNVVTSQKKTAKVTNHAGVSSPIPQLQGEYSHALTTQCSWCWKG